MRKPKNWMMNVSQDKLDNYILNSGLVVGLPWKPDNDNQVGLYRKERPACISPMPKNWVTNIPIDRLTENGRMAAGEPWAKGTSVAQLQEWRMVGLYDVAV